MGGRSTPRPGTGLVLGATVLSEGLLFGLAALILFWSGRESLLAQLVPQIDPALVAGVGAGAGLAGAVLVLLLYRLWPGFRRSAESVLALFRQLSLPVLAVVSLLSALGEEALFRGALQPILGLWGAALVFALVHTGLKRELWAYGVTAFLVGVLFGLAYQFTGELWSPVVGHALYNLLISAAIGAGCLRSS
ncbi:MAG: CPBP family intramembrane metalloprotease [Bacillota bacterium]|nr:CPBP family intramembrane metalloprotease [Bacillota bacterium]